MQIYVLGLVEIARRIPVGGSWELNREKVMLDIGITDLAFDDLQQRIETSLPGRWSRCSASDRKMYVYTRVT